MLLNRARGTALGARGIADGCQRLGDLTFVWLRILENRTRRIERHRHGGRQALQRGPHPCEAARAGHAINDVAGHDLSSL